jgi:hypothetical protein
MTAVARPPLGEKEKRLADPAVRRWYEYTAKGAQKTADNYLRSLFNFCDRMDTTTAAVAGLTQQAAFELLNDFVTLEEKRGIAGSTIATYVKCVKSWLVFHNTKVVRKVKVKNAERRPTLAQQEVPPPEGLRAILLRADPEVERNAISLIAGSGLRLEVVGSQKDGLRVSDIQGLTINRRKVTFETLPARIIVRAELSKTKEPYSTWLGTEFAGYVKDALEARMRLGKKVKPDSPVVATRSGGFFITHKLSTRLRAVIDEAGFDFRPYTFRNYFATQVSIAVSKGRASKSYMTYWMGHKGDMDAQYVESRAAAHLIAEMAEAFHRVEPLLETAPTSDQKKEIGQQVAAAMLRMAHYTDEQVTEILCNPKSDIDELVRIGLNKAAVPLTQRIVSIEEAKPLMSEGWRVHTTVGTSLVMDPPN